MQKRIRISAITTTLLCLLFFTGICLLWINESFTSIVRNDMDSFLKSAVYLSPDYPEDFEAYAKSLAASFQSNVRITVIDGDGNVLGDSHADAATMGNHSDRPEIIAAWQNGMGENVRNSETRGVNTMYIARVWQGDTVLRLAIPFTPVPDFLKSVLPAFVVSFVIVVILMFFLSKKTTQRVTASFGVFTEAVSAAVENAMQGKATDLPKIEIYEEFTPIIYNFESLFEKLYTYIDLINEKQKEVEKIISSMEEGLILLDRDFNILLSNAVGLAVFNIPGKSPEKNILHLYREEQFIAALKQIRENGKNFLFDIQRAEGAIYRVHVSTVADEGFVILTTDITHVTRLEKVRSEFSANVSHELKTPITSISGFAELINTGMVSDPEKIREYSHKIYTESQRLIELIDDLLKLSEIENSPGPYENENRENSLESKEVDLPSAFNTIVELLKEKAAKKNVTVEIVGSGKLKIKYSHFVELATNLLDNAIKYNVPDGKVTITIHEDEKTAGFTVGDTGIGIPLEERERVFERFYRVDKGRNGKVEGTGLGLSIVKHIVQAYRGEIQIKGGGSGTEITVLFHK